MLILAFYTMRKRGLTIRDVMQRGKNHVRRGPPTPPKYGMDNKQAYEDNYAYARKNSVFPPLPAAINSRSNSLSTHRPLQPLARSDRYVHLQVYRISGHLAADLQDIHTSCIVNRTDAT